MIKTKSIVFVHDDAKTIKKHFPRILCFLIFFIATITTFALQDQIVGFQKGYDEFASKHHGSVSSRGLAIISSATPENHFVGFAIRFKDEQGRIQYDYFDRYPVFFSALFNRVLTLRPKLSSKVYLAKQVMNLIFIATIAVALLLCAKLAKSWPLSIAAVLIAFSNPYLLFYKDMVHFDQPALFGFLLLIYAIALYKLDGRRRFLLPATLVAVSLGRGYASFAVLGLWLAMEAFLILKERGLKFGQQVIEIARHPAFRMMVIGVTWGALLLSYNIFVEARTRNISVLETSIVDSASRRLALDEEFNRENEHIINWPEYTRTEINRIIQWAFPIKKLDLGFWGNCALLALMFLVTGIVIRRQPVERRMVFLILAFSGFAWLIPMRNLAAFHDYTTMYFIGLPLAFLVSLLALLKPSRDAAYYLAVMGLIVYVSAISQARDLHETIADNASEYTYDFMRIESAIGSSGQDVYLDSKIPYTTNAEEFYLQNQYLAPLSLADYVISADRNYAPENLTPNNSVMFLFKNEHP